MIAVKEDEVMNVLPCMCVGVGVGVCVGGCVCLWVGG
jgi:hypothetical protein